MKTMCEAARGSERCGWLSKVKNKKPIGEKVDWESYVSSKRILKKSEIDKIQELRKKI